MTPAKPDPAAAAVSSSSSSNSSSGRCALSLGLFYSSFACLAGIILASSVVPLPVLLQMVLYTAPVLYIGSHLSLKQNERDAITGHKLNKGEAINRTDAMLFPIFGSVALFSLYLAYKFLGSFWVNMLLTIYLSAVGFVALGETLYAATLPLCPPAFCLDKVLRIPLCSCIHKLLPKPSPSRPQQQQQQDGDSSGAAVSVRPHFELSWNWLWLCCHVVALAICCLWLLTKHWALHNILAIAFCIQAIAIVSVGSFTIAAILLCGLFVYDVFWVFGTEVMVSVAKYSILGLGDIVIPGVLVSMCLRFDAFLAHQQQLACTNSSSSNNNSQPATDIHQRFPKFYFLVVLVFYEMGLLTTGIVMLAVQHPQPALLYLVPYCLFSLFGAAALNGKVKDVLAYKEDDETDAAAAESSVEKKEQ